MNNKRASDEYYASVGPAIGSVVQPVRINSSALPFLITLNRDSTILSVVFETILLLFALWAFVKHALEAKTWGGGWSINVLLRTLVADHVLYFVCYLAWQALSLVVNNAESSFPNVLLDDLYDIFSALVVVAGPRMVISLRATEDKTRGEGRTSEDEVVSIIQFGIQEPHTQSESVMEEGGFRATDANAQMD
ncbi:hypothetical protein BJ138DRAFT_1165145 [Hygrophoropsis aurantiaca]|uniref:Uncharacterized protein n=1 Tax=Hygrophoropsis aurantiaca TaxID=72124 RepID=A0ACB7ZX31_9AGAM|nr:hypothetical protein BJ138DRAFT_1165145 [Hygrophoropsis aurantiaca]